MVRALLLAADLQPCCPWVPVPAASCPLSLCREGWCSTSPNKKPGRGLSRPQCCKLCEGQHQKQEELLTRKKKKRAAAENILCTVSFLVCLVFFTSAWLSLPEYPVVYSVKKLQEGSLQQLCELLGFANPSASPCPGGGFVPGCLLLLLDSQTESSCSAVKEIKPLKMTKFFFWFVPNFQKTSGQAPSRPAMAPLHRSLRRFVD